MTIKISITTLLVLMFHFSLLAQSNVKEYQFSKGEVLDILLLTSKPDTDALLKDYFKTVFPVAEKLSYQSLPGFRINSHTQGGLQPTSFILGKWDKLEKKEKFLAEVEDFVPDFHKRRRDIWSIFYLTYYEMKSDINFSIDKDKYNVVTAYWNNNDASFGKFKKNWVKKASAKNGEIILELTDAKSPMGYYNKPDYVVITEWENEQAFQKFHSENVKMNHDGIYQVNQFVIN